MQFVKVPNMLFHFDLKPIDILVYCGIRSFCDQYLSIIVKAQKIADRCGIHRNSVKPSVDRLQALGLIKCVKRTQMNGYRACHLYKVADPSGKWFKIDFKVFTYNLKPSAFVVYAYIQSRSNHAYRAFPSYKQITEGTGISLNTAINAVKTLMRFKLLNRKHVMRIIDCFGHNEYRLLSVLLRVTGRIYKRAIQLLTTSCMALLLEMKFYCSYIIAQIRIKIKTSFMCRHRYYRKI